MSNEQPTYGNGYADKLGCVDTIDGVSIPADWWSRCYEYPWVLHNIKKGTTVVDAGCGVEHPLKLFLASRCSRVYAVDTDARISDFTGPANVEYRRESICSIGLPTGSVDAVVCVSVLEHMPVGLRDAAFREFSRLIKPDGRILITADIPTVPIDTLRKLSESYGLRPYGEVNWTVKPSSLLEPVRAGRTATLRRAFCIVLIKG
jgi:SAM-dependent methyltransferase